MKLTAASLAVDQADTRVRAQLAPSELVKKAHCGAWRARAERWALINASASQSELAAAEKKQTVRNLIKFPGKERA